jgi:hypothetical protein
MIAMQPITASPGNAAEGLGSKIAAIIGNTMQNYKKAKDSEQFVDTVYKGIQNMKPGYRGLDQESIDALKQSLTPTDADRDNPDKYEERVSQAVKLHQEYCATKFYSQQAKSMEPSAKSPAEQIPAGQPAGAQPPGMGQPPMQQPSPTMGPPKQNNMPISNVAGGGPPTLDLVQHRADQDLSTMQGQQPPSVVGVPNAQDAARRLNFSQDAGLFSAISQGQPAPAQFAGPGASETPQGTPGMTRSQMAASDNAPVAPTDNLPHFDDETEKTIATFSPKYQPVVRSELENLHQELKRRGMGIVDEGKGTPLRQKEALISDLRKEDAKQMDVYQQHKETLSNQRGINENTQGEENKRSDKRLAFERWKTEYEAAHKGGPGGNTNIDLSPKEQDWIKKHTALIVSGQAPADMSDLTSRSGMAKYRPYIEQELSNSHPEFNIENAKGDEKYWNSQQTRKQIQVMDVVSEQLPKLKKIRDKMKLLNIPILDSKGVQVLAAKGDVNAAEYLASSAATVEDIGKAIAGGNAITDDQLKLAQRMLPPGSTVKQLDRQIKAIESAVNSRKATVYRQGGVYGKVRAKSDPYLDKSVKDEILGTSSTGTGTSFDDLWAKHGGQ